ncbi:MAG: amino acid ABC transporter permease [Propionicimonas sp.]
MTAEATVLFDAPGPKARRRHRIGGVLGSLVLLGLLAGAIYKLADPANNQFSAQKWAPFIDPVTWTAYLIPGLIGTLVASIISVILSIVLGLILGIGRLVPQRWIRWACGAFVEFFRSVPVLMMMLFAYYFGIHVLRLGGAALPLFGVVVGLTVYNSCVLAELVRSGVYSLPKGQQEAGLAIGLTPIQTLVTILLPQAITAMLPSMLSQLVVILKDSALGTMIAYAELMRQATTLDAVYGNLIPALMVVGVLYLLMNGLLTRGAAVARQRLRRSPQKRDIDPVTAGMVPEPASEPQVPYTLIPPPEPDEPPVLLPPRRHRRDPE